MKIVLRLMLVAALAALGVWLWTVLFPGPEKVIRRRLVELAHTASVSISDGDLVRLAAARRLAGFFSTNVEMNLDLPGLPHQNIMDRDQITQAAMIGHTRTVKFPDINITVAPGQQSATVEVTVEAEVSGEQGLLVQEMKFTLMKIDGEWLIVRVETVRTLSRGPQIFPAILNFALRQAPFIVDA